MLLKTHTIMSTKSVKQFDRERFEKHNQQIHLELQGRQRQYHKDLEDRLPITRQQYLLIQSYKDRCHKMKEEKNVLKAKIWTASGTCHKERNNHELHSIQCLVECNISLTEEVQRIKLSIQHLDHKLNMVSKDVNHMRMVEIQKCQGDVEKARKSLLNLEDQYENLLQLECKLSAKSEKLRCHICDLLNERKVYHSLYTKYIQRLTTEKKYLTDLIDFALDKIEMVINMYETLEQQFNHYKRELEKCTESMRSFQRNRLSVEKHIACNKIKGRQRPLAGVPDKEIRRLGILRKKYLTKINLYNGILKKILHYTNELNIESVTIKFQKQESLYYSYSNFSNEISYRITLLNNSVARLFGEIHELKLGIRDKQKAQIEMIENLETILAEKRTSNQDLRKVVMSQNDRVATLFEAFQLIRDQSRTDMSPLVADFDDYHEINIKNMREQMKLLEKRIYTIVCAIYTQERDNPNRGQPVIYLVKNLEKIIDLPTSINDIVLTTECAECAEDAARDRDDLEHSSIMPAKQVKKLVADQVRQPEMQYRLHSIHQCRLPRSRKLAQNR